MMANFFDCFFVVLSDLTFQDFRAFYSCLLSVVRLVCFSYSLLGIKFFDTMLFTFSFIQKLGKHLHTFFNDIDRN